MLSACEEPPAALGPTRIEAQTRASDLLAALAGRFGPIDRDPAFDAVRPKLVQNALTPSRIVDDPLAWTIWEGTRRTVELFGKPQASGYRIGLRAGAPLPLRPGEYRGVLRLRAEGRGAYEWLVRDELAVGGLRPADAAHALEALFRGAESAAGEGRGAPVDLRPQVLRALPNAAAAFGRLYALETLRATRQADGATAIELRVALEPARLRRVAPRYAWFLEKYATPIELRAEASVDAPTPDGVTPAFWIVEAAQRRATLRLRLRDGRLALLRSASGTVGDRLSVSLDYSTRAGPFRVGVRRLEAEVAFIGALERTSFTATFRREPEWRLPFVIRPLLRGSLRRPFEGEGSVLEYTIGEKGGVTRLERSYRLTVQENWIVRWIGGFTASAVSDFRRYAEAESDRFTADGLHALRKDVETLLR